MNQPAILPDEVTGFLDGTNLPDKVGPAILLMAAEPDGWPRLALLSVGEVLAVPPTEIRLALYPNSGTTRALTESGRGLLSVVLDGAAYRIRVATSRVPDDGPLAYFRGRLAEVDIDRVGYATLRSGVTYDLPDQQPVLDRWREQLDRLRAMAP